MSRPNRIRALNLIERWQNPDARPSATLDITRRLLAGESLSTADIQVKSLSLLSQVIGVFESAGWRVTRDLDKRGRTPATGRWPTLYTLGKPPAATQLPATPAAAPSGATVPNGVVGAVRDRLAGLSDQPPPTHPALGITMQVRALALTAEEVLVMQLLDETGRAWRVTIDGHTA